MTDANPSAQAPPSNNRYMDKLPVPVVSLEAKVAFLRLPSSYAERAVRVDAIETHMAWVFLTSGFAYKLKKPVHNPDLDFSTVEARHYFCEEEPRLNRRLAADVDLGLVALRLDSAGHLRLGGLGIPVDWLVMMRRLPAENMLDYAMLHGLARDSDMRRVARRLVAFYRRCTPLRIDPPSYRQRFAYGIGRQRTALAALCSTAADARVERLCHGQRAALQRVGALLDQRGARRTHPRWPW
jgi:aminoglycoside phosphotransferase family enzyme